MMIVYRALAPWSPFFLPIVFPAVGYVVAAILRQEHWHALYKDLLAWIVLVVSAVLDIIASDKWTNDPTVILPALSGIAALLIAGAYGQLAPWLQGMQWIEKTFFNLPTSIPVSTALTPSLLTGASFWSSTSKAGTTAPSNATGSLILPEIPPTERPTKPIRTAKPSASPENPTNAG